MSSLKYWVWLSSLKKVSAAQAHKVLEIFGSPEKAYFARDREIDVSDLSNDVKSAVKDKNMDEAGKIIDRCAGLGISIAAFTDAVYPARLRNIYDPPVVLYMKGNVPPIDDEAVVSVVGTRNCTPYGIKQAERMGYELSKAGCVIATGLARGIDSASAAGALRAGGRVIGVLGNGLDVVYPRENGRLFDDVCVNGGLISEYPPGTAPHRGNFPVRNRILSGIALGVLVIEAPARSGALITAGAALEQGRDVFAVPGNADSKASEGSNNLIKDGAALVTCGMDIAEEYMAQFPDKIKPVRTEDLVELDGEGRNRLNEKELAGNEIRQEEPKKPIDNENAVNYIDLKERPEGMSESEYAVLKVLNGQMQADEIVEKTGLSAAKALATLTVLEIKGYVKQLPGKVFSRK